MTGVSPRNGGGRLEIRDATERVRLSLDLEPGDELDPRVLGDLLDHVPAGEEPGPNPGTRVMELGGLGPGAEVVLECDAAMRHWSRIEIRTPRAMELTIGGRTRTVLAGYAERTEVAFKLTMGDLAQTYRMAGENGVQRWFWTIVNPREANPIVTGRDDPLVARNQLRWESGSADRLAARVRAILHSDTGLVSDGGRATLVLPPNDRTKTHLRTVGLTFDVQRAMALFERATAENKGWGLEPRTTVPEGAAAYRLNGWLTTAVVTLPVDTPSAGELAAARRTLREWIGSPPVA
jgi:hypothetical protein